MIICTDNRYDFVKQKQHKSEESTKEEEEEMFKLNTFSAYLHTQILIVREQRQNKDAFIFLFSFNKKRKKKSLKFTLIFCHSSSYYILQVHILLLFPIVQRNTFI